MHLLFDLDGTLTDPFVGITTCIQYALEALERPYPSSDDLAWCIGPPLRESFATLLGIDHEHLVDAALKKYRERFGSIGIYENKVYPGINTVLGELKNLGHSLGVATTKPTVFAKKIIKHFNLEAHFISVDGSELDGTRTDKAELIAYILERDGIATGDVVMIGDRKHDIIGARKNTVTGIGVLWGYGSRNELESAGAHAFITSPGELGKLIQTWVANSKKEI